MLNRFTAAAICLLLISCARPRHTAATPAAPHADSPDDAAEFLRQERVSGKGPVPGERYLEARRRLRGMRTLAEHPEAVSFGTWQSLGPGNVGGRTRALVIHPQNSNVMWAGGATAGVWKTVDGGQTWKPQTDFLPVLVLNSMIMDPSNPDVLYAGTGEQTQNWRGAGIFKTADGGQTWNQLPSTGTSDFYFVNQMAASKTTGNIYAATNTGLWASADGGATWSLALAAPDGGPNTTSNGGLNTGCFDVAISPSQPKDVVFAACHPLGSPLYAIFRNLDAAGTGVWTEVQSDPQMWYTALAIAPSEPTTIYAISVTHDNTSVYAKALLAVYRSVSNGDPGTWETRTSNTGPTRLNTAILSVDSAYNFTNLCTGMSPVYSGQDGYNLFLAVDPLDPNRLWAAGIGLFRSDDGGANWGYAFYGAHPDQHFLRFDPAYDGVANQTLYSANDGGVYKTTHARGLVATCSNFSTSVIWSALNNSYVTTQFYHGTPYPGGSAYFGGTQDNGTVRGTDASGLNQWSSIYGGDGGVSRLDPVDASTVYVEYVHGALAKSTNAGLTYIDGTNGIAEPSGNFTFIAFYTFDPNNSLRLYVGGSQLWRTEDGMNNWTAASAPIPPASSGAVDSITSIAVSPADPNLVLFGSRFNGNIFRSTTALSADGSTTWSSTQPRAGNVSHIEFDPNRRNTVYATYSTFNSAPSDRHVYRSTDGGATWTGIDGSGNNGLPDVPVNTLLVDPDDSTRLYLGTDLGLFASFDGGITWSRDANPFADVMTRHLTIDRAGGRKDLYAFTYGRGIWRVALGNTGANNSTCSYTVSPSSPTADATGATLAVGVSTAPNCPWTLLPAPNAAGFVSPQAPATGVGSGTAFITVAPNTTAKSRIDSLVLQNQVVSVTQQPGSSLQPGDEAAAARAIPSLPFQDAADNSALTSNASDPTHSCTQSPDSRTGWFRFTAASTGSIRVSVTAVPRDGQGTDDGVVVAAYPLNGASSSAELACANVPNDNGAAPVAAVITFPVTGGNSYLIETASLAGNAASDVGIMSITVVTAPSAAALAVSPANVAIAAGQSAQFTAGFTNLSNQQVRWTVSPQVGVISPAGVYTAPAPFAPPQTLTVTAQSLANPALQASATVAALQNLPATLPQPSVTNAASFQAGPMSPGEVITLFGSGMGPSTLITAQLDSNGRLANLLGGSQVLFDGIAAPLVYVSGRQISAIVPYEVASQASTQMTVVANGQSSPPLTLQVTPIAPALFTADSSGGGQAAAVNADGSLNGPQNGAAAGAVLTLYGTGEGQTVPVGLDGLIANSSLPAPAANVTVTIGGINAAVVYAGAAGQEVAGVLQLNVKVPAGLSSGANPVVVTIGGISSRSDVTVTVK